MVGASHSTTRVGVQDGAVKVALAALADRAHTGSGRWGGGRRDRQSESTGLVREITLRGGLAGTSAPISASGVGVPQTRGVAQTRPTIVVVGARARIGGVRGRIGRCRGQGKLSVCQLRSCSEGGSGIRTDRGSAVITSCMHSSEQRQRTQEAHIDFS